MTGMADWAAIFGEFWHLCVAFALAGAIGWNREQEEHNVGVRSFPIVAMAACTFVMIASYGGDVAAQSRVLQGLVAGIGFVGGGAILKDGPTIKGRHTDDPEDIKPPTGRSSRPTQRWLPAPHR